MGKQSLKRDSAKLTDQRIPAFVTRLVMEGPKLKPNREENKVGESRARLKDWRIN